MQVPNPGPENKSHVQVQRHYLQTLWCCRRIDQPCNKLWERGYVRVELSRPRDVILNEQQTVREETRDVPRKRCWHVSCMGRSIETMLSCNNCTWKSTESLDESFSESSNFVVIGAFCGSRRPSRTWRPWIKSYLQLYVVGSALNFWIFEFLNFVYNVNSSWGGVCSDSLNIPFHTSFKIS